MDTAYRAVSHAMQVGTWAHVDLSRLRGSVRILHPVLYLNICTSVTHCDLCPELYPGLIQPQRKLDAHNRCISPHIWIGAAVETDNLNLTRLQGGGWHQVGKLNTTGRYGIVEGSLTFAGMSFLFRESHRWRLVRGLSHSIHSGS